MRINISIQHGTGTADRSPYDWVFLWDKSWKEPTFVGGDLGVG